MILRKKELGIERTRYNMCVYCNKLKGLNKLFYPVPNDQAGKNERTVDNGYVQKHGSKAFCSDPGRSFA